jgi:hypothetical protein
VPDVHGIAFSSNQSELVKSLIRELLKDGGCAVYALPHMKPNGELRMACTPPVPTPKRQRGIFVRILPGTETAVVMRPLNARSGPEKIHLTKYVLEEVLDTVRSWRSEVNSITPRPPVRVELPMAA